MINNNANLGKTPRLNNLLQHLPAGIFTKDNSIEAFGDSETRELFFYRNGIRLILKKLPQLLLVAIYEHLKSNPVAYAYLNKKFACKYDQMNEYIFCMWGQSDHKADFKLENGKWILSTPENFNCSNGGPCKCFNWAGKENRINNKVLTAREIYIIRQMYLNQLDTVIAMGLGIKIPTYNTHKKTLFTKLNVTTRTELVNLALQNKVV